MKIIIVTTENEGLNETGFGGITACLAIKKALRKRFSDVRISVCARVDDMEIVMKNNPDMIILAAKYLQNKRGEKHWFSEYYEENLANFTGSKKRNLEVSSDKIWAKEVLTKQGILTAPYLTVNKNDFPLQKDIMISYPIFLKPLDAANGIGIDDHSVVYEYFGFQKQAAELFQKYGTKILAEEYLPGREFTVSIIEDRVRNSYFVSPIEIIAPTNNDDIRILGEKVKKCNVEVLNKVTDELLRGNLIKIAIRCFKALGASDYARIDIRQDENKFCHFLEANLVPGMTEGRSYFPKAFEIDRGINYPEVVTLMMKNAFNRIIKDKTGTE